MRRHCYAPVCLALLILLAPRVSAASAGRADDSSHDSGTSPALERTAFLRIHGGPSFQTGNFGNDQGIGGGASIGYALNKKAMLYLDAAFHYFPLSGAHSWNMKRVVPVTLNAEYHVSTRGGLAPWFAGGAGLYHVEQNFFTGSSVQNNFGAKVGVGLAAPTGRGTGSFGTGLMLHYAWGRLVGDTYQVDTDAAFVTFEAALALGL